MMGWNECGPDIAKMMKYMSPENKKLIAARMAEMEKANTEQAEVS